jgi:hypothetical protein
METKIETDIEEKEVDIYRNIDRDRGKGGYDNAQGVISKNVERRIDRDSEKDRQTDRHLEDFKYSFHYTLFS